MIRVERFDITGLTEALAYLQFIDDELQRPTEGLSRSVHAVAKQWHQNFDAEGRTYKQWKGLAGETVAERSRLGYGPEHPILKREGSLLSTAIEFFENVNGMVGSASGDGIHSDFSISGQEARLHMYGPKARNQSGGGRLPARPFWYSEGKASKAARDATEAWLKEKFG